MTEYQIASSIQNYVTSGQGVTGSSIDIEQIRDEVDTLRVRFIDEIDKKQINLSFPFYGFEQTIFSISTKKDSSKQSYIVVPKIFSRLNGKPAIDFIGSKNRITPYRIVTGNQNIWAKSDKYVGDRPIAWVYEENGESKIVFKNATPDIVTLVAVFEKPINLSSYNGYDFKSTKYPMPSSYIDMVIGKTSESYMRHFYRIFPQPNNTADIPQGQPRK